MKYHYYIGLQLPPHVREGIAKLQKELFDPIESIEPLEPHITLLPPPAVETIPPADLCMHAKAAAQHTWPLQISLDEVITFQEHAVALRADGGDEIHALQQRLVELLPFETEVQYFPNPHFTPHVTLVQAIRGKTLPSRLIQEYGERLAAELPINFTVDHLTLFEWTGPRQYNAKKI
jgi:2'-5' RNA ligase